MIKIDLITGFLGAGKTTFLKQYASHLIALGKTVAILENDHGAVNVDAMLLQELGDGCDVEMVTGGSDYATHQRRFKTKLIAMGMRGYDRVLIEPSGVFDVEEFFDLLYEEPLNAWYEIGSVIAVVDASLNTQLSSQASYLLASQIAYAGVIVMSKTQLCDQEQINRTLLFLRDVMDHHHAALPLTEHVLCKDWSAFTAEDYCLIKHAGYRPNDILKAVANDNRDFMSCYYFHVKLESVVLRERIGKIFDDAKTGAILRIKGFLRSEDGWLEVNATHREISLTKVLEGQEVLIVIGENLNDEAIQRYLKA